jgi:hypothetical protein
VTVQPRLTVSELRVVATDHGRLTQGRIPADIIYGARKVTAR